MENIEFVEATAAEVAEAVQPKRKSKKAKPEAVAEPVAEPVVELPELQCGHVVYRNDYTHVIGFECNGMLCSISKSTARAKRNSSLFLLAKRKYMPWHGL